MPRILTPRDYRVMPWKNGGGTTTEIHIHPEGTGWDAFQWRVGIADIAQSGSFSSFSGIDRSIMLLECAEGSGMRLTIDGNDVDLPLHRFIDFRGEATTYGTLLAEPVRDFNVMSRRNCVRHQRGDRTLAPGEALRLAHDQWKFAYIAAGEALIAVDGSTQLVAAGHSLLANADDVLEVQASGTGCLVIWATFSPVDSPGRGL